MKKVSLVNFRLDMDRILSQVKEGQRMVLTRRGKPVARLEPMGNDVPDSDDPFYSLTGLGNAGESLSNKQIDEILYGS